MAPHPSRGATSPFRSDDRAVTRRGRQGADGYDGRVAASRESRRVSLALARESGPEWVVDEVRRSGLRGRGGAGFPTGMKWRSVREDPNATTYVVCNAAEGEPGAFKDRWLLRHDPYAVLEGLAIAAIAVGASGAWIGMKAGAEREVARVQGAMQDMAAADLLGPVPVELVAGPDEYLFGDEKALLEVI